MSTQTLRSLVFTFVLLAALWGLAVLAPPLEAGVGITLPIVVEGYVTLQRPNAPPPDPSWSVPLVVTFHLPGDPAAAYTWNVTTDTRGRFVITDTVELRTYDVRVKNIHTLRNVKENVAITAGVNTLDLGELREGDANNDNRVNIQDFTILRSAYFTEEGQAGFDPRADFDEDNRVNVRDFALLRANYFAEGDVLVPRAFVPQEPVTTTLWLEPPVVRGLPGEVYRVTVRLNTANQAAVGADVVLAFDPNHLQVVDETGAPADTVVPGDAFDVVLKNVVDNTTGRITFGAGTFGVGRRGNLALFHFYLRADRAVFRTPLEVKQADVVDETGRSLPLRAFPGALQAGPYRNERLPVIGWETPGKAPGKGGQP